MSDDLALATVELLGALTYAQLRAFEVAAGAIRHAPDVRAADRVAAFAVTEHQAYRRLRDRLEQLTDLPEPPMDHQKARVDAFFDGLPVDDWVSASTFFAVGLPMAADFARAVAPALDPDTAAAVVEALAERHGFERYASEQVAMEVARGSEPHQRVRRLTAEIAGSALTEFQGAVTSTDALLLLLERLEEHVGDEVLRHTAVALLEQHRRRMAAIGVDSPE